MNQYKKQLMSKNGRVTMLLAREMMSYHEGYRIKTIGEYSESFGMGRGTVQSALRFLQEAEAIKLESKGHLGTYIDQIDYKKLWSISDLGVIMGVMPLPYSKRYEGLATGFYKAFEKVNVPFSLAFMRGATKRIEALTLEKYNFAIISKLAANMEIERSSSIEIIHEFGEGSYVGNHVVIFRDGSIKKIADGMRVALDPASIDQFILTSYECEGKNVEYVTTPYNQILQKLKNNEIDAAIWNVDEIEEKNLKFNISPFSNPKTRNIDKEDTIAVAAVSKNNPEFGDVLRRFIDFKEVEEMQKKVINQEVIPIY
ncbi:MAG TPA: GntR family transcriptional regulator YhfZ [Clostridia bacterium]|nr:GntR family transcriptional regulator YhfZ [Clostridia bacterium]